jgi:hypothetical protein
MATHNKEVVPEYDGIRSRFKENTREKQRRNICAIISVGRGSGF